MATKSTRNSTTSCLASPDFDPYNITSLPDSVRPTWFFFCTLNGIFAPTTFFLNLLIVWTVLKDKNLRSVSYNLLLAALSVTDLLTGLVGQPMYAWFLGCMLTRCSLHCEIFTSHVICGITLACLSGCTLMMLSIERYLAIELPLYFTMYVTTKKMMVATAITWVTVPPGALLIRILVNKSPLRKIPTLVVALIVVFIILFCTIKVQLSAYRQRRRIALQHVPEPDIQQDKQEEQQNRLQEYKRTLTAGLLVIATVLFYCPFIITVIIEVVKGKDVTDDFKYISHSISGTFIFLQSFVNPLIMSLRLSYIREGVRNNLQRCINLS